MSTKLAKHSSNLHQTLLELCPVYRLMAIDIQFTLFAVHHFASWLIGCQIPIVELALSFNQSNKRSTYPYLLFSNAETLQLSPFHSSILIIDPFAVVKN